MLTEAIRTRLFSIKSKDYDNCVGYYSSRKATIPFVIIKTNEDTVELFSLTKISMDIIKGKVTPDNTEEAQKYLQSYAFLEIDKIKSTPTYVEYEKLSYSDAFKVLTKKHKFPPERISHLIDSDTDDNGVEYNGVTILGNIKPKELEVVKTKIDELKKAMKPRQLDWLVNGKIFVDNLSAKKTLGYYDYNKDFMVMNKKALNNASFIKTLVHEHAHKLENMKNFKDKVDQKYKEVVKDGNTFTTAPKLELQDIIVYQDTKFEVRRIREYAKEVVAVEVTDEVMKKSIKVPFSIFSSLSSDIKSEDGSIIPLKDHNDWFPSQYSTTNAREFFAENFLHWVNFNTNEEVSNWIRSLYK